MSFSDFLKSLTNNFNINNKKYARHYTNSYRQHRQHKKTAPIVADVFTNTAENENTVKLPNIQKTHVIPSNKAELVSSNATLLIIYKDIDDNLLVSSELISGKLGSDFRLRFKEFPNYILIKIHGFTSTFVDEYGVVTLTYRKRTAANVWIFCVDADDNNFLHKPTFLNGCLNDSYSLASPTIKGYHLLYANGPVTGSFSNKQQVVTYAYRKATWKRVDYVVLFLQMKNYVVCYDDPAGKKTRVTLAKGTIWQTFQKILFTDGSSWYCMGGNIWIKNDSSLFKIVKPYSTTKIQTKVINLPFSTKLNQPAKIDFVPNKETTIYNNPFGQPLRKISHDKSVTLTAKVNTSHMTWFEVDNNGWINSQYLKY